jgi:hypothetical protein
MKTINEITDDELIFNERCEFQLYGYELKREWNSLSVDDRSSFRTSKERTIKLSAETVLDWIYESMDSEGYEDMISYLWNDTTEEFKQRVQALLDEISNFPSAKVYDIDEPINPYVDLEEN